MTEDGIESRDAEREALMLDRYEILPTLPARPLIRCLPLRATTLRAAALLRQRKAGGSKRKSLHKQPLIEDDAEKTRQH